MNTYTPTYTPTNTDTFTLTATETNTDTNSPTKTPTNSPTLTPTFTATYTPTPTPPSSVSISKQSSESNAQSGDSITYVLNIGVTGNAIGNAAVTDVLPGNETFQGFLSSPPGTGSSKIVGAATTLVWTLPANLAPGNYQITYAAQVNNFIQGGAILNNCAQLSYAGGAPVSSCVSVPVIGQFTVQVGVYNEAGELVKEILVTQFSNPVENVTLQSSNVITTLSGAGSTIQIYYQGYLLGTWNGTTTNGSLVTNGTYYIKVDNIDSHGVDRSTTVQAMVSRTLYQTTVLIYNEAGEVVKHLYAYTSDPGQAVVTSAKLSNNVIEPTYGTPGAGTPAQVTITLSNGTTLVWNGMSDNGSIVQSGQYFVEITSADGQGGNTIIAQRISVLDGAAHNGMGAVFAQPNSLDSANGFTTTFRDTTGESLTLTVHIYTIAGELAALVNGQAGTNAAPWNASNLASGLYLAVIDSVDANGGIVNHKTIKLLVVH